jgi:Protein of unknown function (DUF2628)
MSTFTVHAPPLRNAESADPERFVFVRDGFYFWAFLLAPLWLFLHRLWLALAGYVALYMLIGVISYFAGVPHAAGYVISLLIGLLVGFEAATLWRWTLARRGWKLLGFATGDDVESAEQRFYSAWAARKPEAPPAPPPAKFAAPIWRGQPSPSDVIGLFPEAGDPR